jgi:predicted nucleotidyltransferase
MKESIKFGLSVSDIDNIISILKNNSRITKVILFGSRAKGNFRAGSDIDIALMGEALKLNDIIQASLKIDELFLPYKIDLVIYDRIKEKELIDHIDRVGHSLYERESPIIA